MVNNVDPLTAGRVQVSVPAVLAEGRLGWAEACVPCAGSQIGLFAVPPVGAQVWVEFEAGDPYHPILAGCFWAPSRARGSGSPTTKILRTDGGTLVLEDLPGGGGPTLEAGAPPFRCPCA